MMGCEFTNIHRTLATYTDAFLRAGFAIERIAEPTVDAADVKAWPELDDELRVPNFILYALRRPGGGSRPGGWQPVAERPSRA
jgi:hypothetical protein